MRKILIFILLILIVSSSFSAEKILKVGVRDNFPPFEYKINNGYYGFNIDILKQLSVIYSLKIEYFTGSSSELKTLLDSNRLDFITMCYQTRDNKDNYNLSSTYGNISFDIFTNNHSKIIDRQDILNKKIAVCNDELFNILSLNKKFTGQIIIKNDESECLDLLKSNLVNLAILGKLSANFIIEKEQIKNLKQPIDFITLQYSYGFQKEQDSIKFLFNEGLNLLKENGTYNHIYNKWFGKSQTIKKITKVNIIFWPFYAVLFVLLVVSYFLVQQRRRYLERKSMILYEQLLRNNTEKEIGELKQNFNLLIDKIRSYVYIQTIDGKFITVNNKFLELSGCSIEQLNNKNYNNAQVREIELKELLKYPQKLENDTTVRTKTKIHTKNNKIIKLSYSKTLIKSKYSKENLMVFVGTDITKEEEIIEDIMKKDLLHQSIINSIPDIIFYKNIKGQYIGSNSAFKKINNILDDSYIGKTDDEIFKDQDNTEYNKTDLEAIKQKKTQHLINWIKTPSGNDVLLETIKVPIIDNNGHVIGVVGIGRDITNLHKAKIQVSKAENKALESERIKTSFLANLTHEIRTPLNSIIGFSDLITDSELTQDQREEFSELIRQSGKSLLSLVDNIIEFSKIENKQLVLKKTQFELNKHLTDLHQHIDINRDIVHKKNVKIDLVLPKNGELPTIVESDHFRLKQIIQNLLKDAIKNTKNGIIEYGYEITDSEILFFVKNIDQSLKNKNNITVDVYKDIKESSYFSKSELSLAIAESLISVLEGKIWMKSNNFNEYSVYFSFNKNIIVDKVQNSEKQIVPKNYKWKEKTILIAEDEVENFKYLKGLLAKTGVSIVWAKNGQEALEMAVKNQIDLILMDVRMPVLDGYQATKEIKKIKSVPIIAQTAYAIPGEANQSKLAGCDDFISKPIVGKNLLKKINKLI